MKRDSYSNQQAHASFQPRSPQSANDSTQLSQPVHHSSSSNELGAKWLNKASRWVADKFQTAQNLMGSGEAIASDQILPALRGTATPSQSAQSDQPLVGVIDSGFGANEHGSKMVEAIQQENPQAKIWRGGGVGTGGGLESLVEFVDVAKATGQTRAVANLSFDLTEVHPDGSISTRTQLTAKEQSALAYARDNGVLVVASAGNQGGAMSALGQASQPFDNLIVVGAANGNDRASYSSYGKGLDLVADVGTAGTSLAAAKTTGAIAKLWSDNPELSSQQVNQMLTATATDLKAPGWDAETGAGLLNSTAAVGLAKTVTPNPPMFSGNQLMQQGNKSSEDSTWRSTNGAVASERTAGLDRNIVRKEPDIGDDRDGSSSLPENQGSYDSQGRFHAANGQYASDPRKWDHQPNSELSPDGKKYLVYVFKDKETEEVRYVGRTSGKSTKTYDQILQDRLSSHHVYKGKGLYEDVGMEGYVDVEIVAVQDNPLANQGAEDAIYEYYLREARKRKTGQYSRDPDENSLGADGKPRIPAGIGADESLEPTRLLPIDHRLVEERGVYREVINDPGNPPTSNQDGEILKKDGSRDKATAYANDRRNGMPSKYDQKFPPAIPPSQPASSDPAPLAPSNSATPAPSNPPPVDPEPSNSATPAPSNPPPVDPAPIELPLLPSDPPAIDPEPVDLPLLPSDPPPVDPAPIELPLLPSDPPVIDPEPIDPPLLPVTPPPSDPPVIDPEPIDPPVESPVVDPQPLPINPPVDPSIGDPPLPIINPPVDPLIGDPPPIPINLLRPTPSDPLPPALGDPSQPAPSDPSPTAPSNSLPPAPGGPPPVDPPVVDPQPPLTDPPVESPVVDPQPLPINSLRPAPSNPAPPAPSNPAPPAPSNPAPPVLAPSAPAPPAPNDPVPSAPAPPVLAPSAPAPSGLSSAAGIAGKVFKPLGVALDVYEIGSAIHEDGGFGPKAQEAATGLAKTAASAAAGAAIGSVVPGIGTLAGGVIGGILGSFL